MRNSAVLVWCGILLLSGCSGGEHDDLRAWMASNAKKTPVKIPPIPQVAPYTASHYQPEGTLDPFKAGKILPESGKSGGGKQPDRDRQPEALEQYPLESLIFVGLLLRAKENYAIIKATDNSLHKVKVGNHLGQNFGVVTEISDVEIILQELIQDDGGEWVERQKTLPLQEQKESKQ